MAYTEGNKEELLDQTPVAIPLGCRKPESMQDMLNRIIGNKFRDLQLDSETETFEEADDFDCEDDFDPASPWEEVFDINGNSLGFVDQNRYQSAKIYERRLDEREQSYAVDKNSNSTNGSFQGDSVGTDSQRSE